MSSHLDKRIEDFTIGSRVIIVAAGHEWSGRIGVICSPFKSWRAPDKDWVLDLEGLGIRTAVSNLEIRSA